MSVESGYKHLSVADNGAVVIDGTSMRVIDLVAQHRAYGWSPEELHFQHPDLSLGQIHAALAYYWDHQAELDQAIRDRLDQVERLHDQLQDDGSPLRRRLASDPT